MLTAQKPMHPYHLAAKRQQFEAYMRRWGYRVEKRLIGDRPVYVLVKGGSNES